MHAETLYVPLDSGHVAEIRIGVLEEPMPAPHEVPHRRTATVRELDEAARKLAARQYQFGAFSWLGHDHVLASPQNASSPGLAGASDAPEVKAGAFTA